MRAAALALLLVAPLLAGCLGGDGGDVQTPTHLPIALDQIRIPEGAVLVEEGANAVLEFANVTLPLREVITIPEGATLVRLEGILLEHDDLGIMTYMKNNETGRRRCNPDVADTAWNVRHLGQHQCSGLTAIDPPGSEWAIQVIGGTIKDPQNPVLDEVRPTYVSAPNLVRVVYETGPLDGFAGQLDLSQLSMPTHDLLATEGFYVESFDGTPLWVEVTLPAGEGPWPTVIASSPYNGQNARLKDGGTAAMWEYWTHDWAKRGYAAVNVDVRGFGLSGGCVEVWGQNEQNDQVFIVDWVEEQEWSDGKVGFYGQSYVGTTPVAAAVQAPDALKAIIAVAPVINAYEDWHIGGVPNAENYLSPVAYQVLTDVPSQNPDHLMAAGPLGVIENAAKGVCEPLLVTQANDPRATYHDYYEERNFKLGASNVKAATLFTQGFEDSNVKSAMIPGWFNEIAAPKLGIFGHWVHQHPTRADEEILFLGWMDEYVKGLDLGFSKLPNAEIVTNVGTHRTAEAWPTPDLPQAQLWPDWSAGKLGTDEGAAKGATLNIAPAGTVPSTVLTVSHEVDEAFVISGTPHLNLRGTLKNGGNAFLFGAIYDVHGEDDDLRRDLITYGAYNLAHDATHETWTPVTGPSDVLMPFLPTEYVFQPGHKLEIVLSGVFDPLAFPGAGLMAGQFVIGEHADGVGALIVDTVPIELYEPLPRSADI